MLAFLVEIVDVASEILSVPFASFQSGPFGSSSNVPTRGPSDFLFHSVLDLDLFTSIRDEKHESFFGATPIPGKWVWQ